MTDMETILQQLIDGVVPDFNEFFEIISGLELESSDENKFIMNFEFDSVLTKDTLVKLRDGNYSDSVIASCVIQYLYNTLDDENDIMSFMSYQNAFFINEVKKKYGKRFVLVWYENDVDNAFASDDQEELISRYKQIRDIGEDIELLDTELKMFVDITQFLKK